MGSLLTALLLVGFGFYLHFLWAGPELKPWHRVRLTTEFTASDYADGRVTTLAQYREREQRLLDQVRTDITQQLAVTDRLPYNRFNPGSLSDPNVWAFNWNRTFVLQPAGDANGGVLLLHGLTDSPYSLRSIGLALAARGYRVVGLRLPGHGIAPAGLLRFEVEDLEAATRLAMHDLRAALGESKPIHMIGYSNGAALAVSYALDARTDATLPRPAGLVLISPAIGITRLAAIGRIRTGLSDLQGFGRAAWQLIEAEVDPYKYQSFSFNAAGVTQRLTSRLTRRIAAIASKGPVRDVPPILAFVSTVDSTVQVPAVIDSLLGRLAPDGHELVVFDVNRLSVVQPMLVADPAPLTRTVAGADAAPVCADADHERICPYAAGRGAAVACAWQGDDRTTARPGLAAQRVLAVARGTAVSARRSAVRLRRASDEPSRAIGQDRDPRRKRRAERPELDADPAAQQPVSCLPRRTHRVLHGGRALGAGAVVW